jgi:hypothetical protein
MHQCELMRLEWFYENQVLSARNRNGKGLKAFHNKPLERAEELAWLNSEQIVSELLVLVYPKIQLSVHGCAMLPSNIEMRVGKQRPSYFKGSQTVDHERLRRHQTNQVRARARHRHCCGG